ncbi:MAG: hypothetical protein ACOY4I_00490 [Bacillota bacterium]
MSLVAIKVGRFNCPGCEQSDLREILKCSGVDLLDYKPGQGEDIVVCESNGISADDIILTILEAGYTVKMYYLAEKLYN